MKSINVGLIILLGALLGCDGAWAGHKIEVFGATGYDGKSACHLNIPGVVLREVPKGVRVNQMQLTPPGQPYSKTTKIHSICDFVVITSTERWIRPGALNLIVRKDKLISGLPVPDSAGEIAYVFDEKQDHEDVTGISINGPALKGSFAYHSIKGEITFHFRQDTVRTATFKGVLKAQRSGL